MRKATAKTRKSNSKGRGSRKPPDFAVVRKKINDLVGNQAVDLVESAIAEADKGHFAAMKYLFEMIGLYPANTPELTQADDSLAKTLLQRLGFPEEAAAEGTVPKDVAEVTSEPAADAVK